MTTEPAGRRSPRSRLRWHGLAALGAPADYLALQASRLNEAMIVAYGAMAGGNLAAVDQVVRLVWEMDRYHGFFPARAAERARAERFAPATEPPLALAAPAEGDAFGAASAGNASFRRRIAAARRQRRPGAVIGRAHAARPTGKAPAPPSSTGRGSTAACHFSMQ